MVIGHWSFVPFCLVEARSVSQIGCLRRSGRAQAILVPDTALHSAAWLDDLGGLAGKPVLTANQVAFWQALHLAGTRVPVMGYGALFAHEPAGS